MDRRPVPRRYSRTCPAPPIAARLSSAAATVSKKTKYRLVPRLDKEQLGHVLHLHGYSSLPRRTTTSPALRRGRAVWTWSASRAGRHGGFGHDVDDAQTELALRPVYQVQLQPAGDAGRQGANDERIVAGPRKQLVADRL